MRYFEIYQSASVLTRVAGVAAAGAWGIAGGGVFDVTAVGHVAGMFDGADAGAPFAVLAVDADPDVDGVFRYQSASADAVRLVDAFAAGCFAAGVVAAVAAVAPERCVPVPAPP